MTSAPLRVAVVGAGPAGAYAVEDLVRRAGAVEVTLLERLLTPWGLVRSGVAPDHPDTKAVTAGFDWAASHPQVRTALGVDVGTDISHADLAAHHHAVIYTVGAPDDQRLDVPGEDLPGSHSAPSFVAWYNGHPDARALRFDLSRRRAIIVGNGNVALDVARILTADVAELRRTDIADHALTALAESAIEEVVILGRRGAADAACTYAELLALDGAPGVDLLVETHPDDLQDPPTAGIAREAAYARRLKLSLLREIAARPGRSPGRRIVLRFASSPLEVLGGDRVEALRVGRNDLIRDADGRCVARPTAETDRLEAGLLLRSVGYRGRATPGVPFDAVTGRIPNDGGAVLDPATQRHVPGLYVAGWAKRGPTGVIGTNKTCARETVRRLLSDHARGALPQPAAGDEGLAVLLRKGGAGHVGLRDWQVLDRHERREGERRGRPRVKVTDPAEMRSIAGAGASSRRRGG